MHSLHPSPSPQLPHPYVPALEPRYQDLDTALLLSFALATLGRYCHVLPSRLQSTHSCPIPIKLWEYKAWVLLHWFSVLCSYNCHPPPSPPIPDHPTAAPSLLSCACSRPEFCSSGSLSFALARLCLPSHTCTTPHKIVPPLSTLHRPTAAPFPSSCASSRPGCPSAASHSPRTSALTLYAP